MSFSIQQSSLSITGEGGQRKEIDWLTENRQKQTRDLIFFLVLILHREQYICACSNFGPASLIYRTYLCSLTHATHTSSWISPSGAIFSKIIPWGHFKSIFPLSHVFVSKGFHWTARCFALLSIHAEIMKILNKSCKIRPHSWGLGLDPEPFKPSQLWFSQWSYTSLTHLRICPIISWKMCKLSI